MQEIWKDIKGYEGFYKVSNYGRIKSFPQEYKMPNGGIAERKGRILKQSKNKINNYRVVTLKIWNGVLLKKTYNMLLGII